MFNIFISPRKSCFLKVCRGFVEPDRSQMTIRCMRIACYVNKATGTHSEYVIVTVLHGNNGYANALNVTLYVH